MILRRLVLASLLFVPLACSHVVVREPYEEAAAGPARLVLREGIAIAEVAGTPEEIGGQTGALFGEHIREILPRFLEALEVGPEKRARAKALEPRIPEDYRRELAAIARAARVSYEDLLVVNALPDTLCSALAAWGPAAGGRPLLLARNLDFWPANVVGAYTVVLVVRPAGKRAFVSVGWPGVNAVVSGMNDAGLAAAVLLNFDALEHAAGTPVCYRIREALERAPGREEALAIFSASEVGSGEFVVFADEKRASAIYEARREFRRVEPGDGILTCSNGDRDPLTELQTDARARCLDDLVRPRAGTIDERLARQALAAVYLDHVNAQAMLFVPAARTLELALGTTLRAAVHRSWVALDLRDCLAGRSVAAVAAREIGRETEPPEHFEKRAYPGARITALLGDAYAKALADAARVEPALDRVGGMNELVVHLAFAAGHADARANALLADAAQKILADFEAILPALRNEPDPRKRAAASAQVSREVARLRVALHLEPALEARLRAIDAEAKAAGKRVANAAG